MSMDKKVRSRLSSIYNAAVARVQPYNLVKEHEKIVRNEWQRGGYNKLILLGFGKGAYPMAVSFEEIFYNIITAGAVITNYGGTKMFKDKGLKKITLYESAHPVPDNNSVVAAKKLVRILRGADESTLVVVLISGGGSALFAYPYEGITLGEKIAITKMLISSGADITEINTVRKHISHVKGGRLAELAYPARVLSLILSDVISDSLDVIASGPCAPDTTTYGDALEVLKKYSLFDKAPKAIREVLIKGLKGRIPETPKAHIPIFNKVTNTIIGSNEMALYGARERAVRMGYDTKILSHVLSGEAKDAGAWLAKIVMETKAPACLICGGETTVTVTGKGLGGRNQELALAFAMNIKGSKDINMLSAGTDGIDGPTDAAGAFASSDTVKHAARMGLNPKVFLQDNNSYGFFKAIDSLFITGQTGTNVMDIQVILINGV